jgi:Protein of unknown function (DUF3102)
MSGNDVVPLPSAEEVILPSQFDYSELSSSVANFLRGQAQRIRRHAASSVINIGKDLAGAKHYLIHGAFVAWVESEVGIPARTAQAYMRVARWASQKGATVAHFPPSLLYMLSASNTPEAFVSDVVRRVNAGERISIRALRDQLRDLRDIAHDRQSPKPRLIAALSHHDDTSGVATDAVADDTILAEVVAILARRLSSQDFTRVRDIMTAKPVLEDPNLAQQIASAFFVVANESANDRGANP